MAFSSFLASAATVFSFFRLYSNGFFFSFFFLLSLLPTFLFPLVPLLFFLLFLLSLAQFSARMGYVIVLGLVFSPDRLCNCERNLV